MKLLYLSYQIWFRGWYLKYLGHPFICSFTGIATILISVILHIVSKV